MLTTNQNHSKPLEVLIVEDEPAAREASLRFLKRFGHRVRSAAGASEAIRKANETKPDVLVCDWKLDGDADGVDVARTLQQQYQVPVIFATAYPLDELREASRDLKVVHYFRKPYSLERLAGVIANLGTP